jgi:hypothetical protein
MHEKTMPTYTLKLLFCQKLNARAMPSLNGEFDPTLH